MTFLSVFCYNKFRFKNNVNLVHCNVVFKGNNSLKIPEDAICNNVTHIIKGRSSKFPKYIKIFQYVDYGNSRCYDWCVTDKDGALIKIDKLLIEYDGRKIKIIYTIKY